MMMSRLLRDEEQEKKDHLSWGWDVVSIQANSSPTLTRKQNKIEGWESAGF